MAGDDVVSSGISTVNTYIQDLIRTTASNSMTMGNNVTSSFTASITTETPAIVTITSPLSTFDRTNPSGSNSRITSEDIRAQQLKLTNMFDQYEKESRLFDLKARLFGEDDDVETHENETRKGKSPVDSDIYVYEKAKPSKGSDDLTKPYRPSAFLTHSKFSDRIAHAEFPRKLRMPTTVTKYDGTGDPNDHLGVFVSAGGIERWTMPVWCHMFVQTLIGAARTWFDSLPEGEIDNFEALIDKFMKHFSQQKRHLKGKSEIHNIRRRDGERVEEFIVRYNKESLQIKGAGEDLRVSGFIHGVRNDDLVRMIHRDGAPETIEEVMEIAKAWVRAENACARMREMDFKKDKKKDSWNSGSVKDKGNSYWGKNGAERKKYTSQTTPSRSEFANNAPRWGGNQTFTPLTKSPSEILATENVRLDKPNPMNPNTIRNPKKFCEFHNEKGHDTDNCWQLKKQIEHAVKNGKLSHLLKNIKDGVEDKGNERGMKRDREVLTLMAASTPKVGSKRLGSEMEDWMSQEISFPPVRGACRTAPLVITAQVGEYKIHRILIDGGSSSDIMYEHCFSKLDVVTQRRLERSAEPLSGFTGEQTYPMGQITLPVFLGEPPATREIHVSFLVVRGKSTHNAILGRTGLALLGGIASTIHAMIKFPTPEGIGVVHADKACENSRRETATTDREAWILHQQYRDQPISIGCGLTADGKKTLKALLARYRDVFAWSPKDMTGVPRSLAEHKLYSFKSMEPRVQKKTRDGKRTKSSSTRGGNEIGLSRYP